MANHTTDETGDSEPSSNPTSMVGRISAKDMGSRAVISSSSSSSSSSAQTKDPQVHQLERRRNDGNRSGGNVNANGNANGNASVGNRFMVTDLEPTQYRPKSEHTQLVWDSIVNVTSRILEDQTHLVVVSAADLVVEILKNDALTNPAKRAEIDSLLGLRIDDLQFNEYANLANRITDYEKNDGGNSDGEDEDENENEDDLESHIIVPGDEDGDDGDGAINDDNENNTNLYELEVQEKDPNSDSEAEAEAESVNPNEHQSEIGSANQLLAVDRTIALDNNEQEKGSGDQIIPLSGIDSFYLQREIKKLYPEETNEQIEYLTNGTNQLLRNKDLDIRNLENELMDLYNYDNFEFIKSCLDNRWRLVYQVRLQETDNETDVEQLFTELELLKEYKLVDELKGKLATSTTKRSRRLLEETPELEHTQSDDETNNNNKKKKRKTQHAREPRIVDLNNLVFDQGSHLMTQSKLKLPPGSFQQNKKLYDIILIPPPPLPPQTADEELVKISLLPQWTQCVFPSSETLSLNRIQSKVYPAAFTTDENLLLCAPTGAGKTNVAMLTILRAIENFRTGDKINMHKFKVVYIAPLKALVQEQMREFQRRLGTNFGIVVNELTGDASLSKKQISETQVLVTTPEKWDVITRKENAFVGLVKLIIIDEIHLLHDERGPVLESIVSRTLRQGDSTGMQVRLVGLSATLPNYKDVAQFLRVDIEKGLFYFDASYRPCPLAQEFIGVKEKKAIKKVAAMNEACFDKVSVSLENNHQIIVFVHSRKETYKTARWLSDKMKDVNKEMDLSDGVKEILKQEASIMEHNNLKEVLQEGFGIHHAGLNKSERAVVEDLFAQGHIRVLVSTATLAWGVNLPAHTVIIKGTDTYSPEKGEWVQLSPQDILQMLGRAGRPRYDTHGEGVIITSHEELQYYMAILNQQLPIESQMISRLADTLNAEIVLGTVKNRDDAIQWLGTTYLYIRMLHSPRIYFVGQEYADDDTLYLKRLDLVHSALTILHDSKLVEYDAISGDIKFTELGRIASHFYINYDSMSMYNSKLKIWSSEIDILKIFSMSGEFKFIPVRQEEKLEITKLMERCPIPIRENATDPLAKMNVLLQTYISRLRLEGFALTADMIYVSQSAGRLLRAIHEIALKKNWASVVRCTLNLCKMVERRMWLTDSPFKQFGTYASAPLIKATQRSHLPFISYFDLSAEELAEAISLKGNSVLIDEALHQFPRLSLSSFLQPITPSMLKVQVEVTSDFNWNAKLHGNQQRFLVIVEDCTGDHIIHMEKFNALRKVGDKESIIEFSLPIRDPVDPVYYVTFLNESWLHSDWRIPLSLSTLKVPKKPSSNTELLDISNIPVSALQVEDFIQTFEFSHFNRFQSQVFRSLYSSDENVFIGMSKGNGKTACAELAILRHWKANRGRIVYIEPSQIKIDQLTKVWNRKYTHLPGKIINKLVGDLSTDLSLINSSHLILATPEQFDVVSRRWRQRKSIQSIELLIVDDVHAVGNGVYAYESVISRMRFMSTQVKLKLRIVGLASPLVYGRDFGEWLGCLKKFIFNFSPLKRFRSLKEIQLHNSDDLINSSLVGTAFAFINKYLHNYEGSSNIVFVPTRRECLDVCSQLVECAVDSDMNLLQVEEAELAPYLDKVSDKTVRQALSEGVGIYYEGMEPTDKLIVEKLFSNGVVSVVVATKTTASYCPLASNVVILTTKEYEEKEHRYVNYSINDVFEMIGSCGSDTLEGRVLVVSESGQSEFYSEFLKDGLPVESFANEYIHDAFMHEISSGIFSSKQDCIDWLTYTYFYRRLLVNPSFYDLKDTSHMGVLEYLSEVVETTLDELKKANLIEVEENEDDEDENEDEDEDKESIEPLTGSMVASYHNVSYATMVELFKLNNTTKWRNMLEVLSNSIEFAHVPVREGEATMVERLNSVIPLPLQAVDADFGVSSTKVFVLLQCYFARVTVPSVDMRFDLRQILQRVLLVVNAAIDLMASEGYLGAMRLMDLSQMIVQGVWLKDSPLKQVPHFDRDILARCANYNVETVYDIMALDDDERDDILRMNTNDNDNDNKLNAVADFVNKYPNIEISYDMTNHVVANEPKHMVVTIERDEDLDDTNVVSEMYPFPKTERWWLVVGDYSTKQLYGIKKIAIARESQQVDMEFTVPNGGSHRLSLWCVCDSYVDADKEVTFEVEVRDIH